MMKIRLACAILATLFVASCKAPGFSLEPRYGVLNAQGDFALTDSGSPVVHNSLRDIGIDGRESAPGLRADLSFASPHLTLDTQRAEWSGSGTVTEFGGISGSNVAVDSEMDFAVHRAVLTFDVLPVPMVELGLGLGVSALDIDATVTEQSSSTKEDIDNLLPVPVLALRLGVHVWRLEFEALVAGMSVNIDGDKAAYFDTDLSARIRMFGMGPVDAFFTAGYRRIDVDADYEDSGDEAEVDVTFDGLYFGLKFSI